MDYDFCQESMMLAGRPEGKINQGGDKMSEIKEAKVDLGKSPPEVECPYCGAKFYGWVLKSEIGEQIECDKCLGKMKLV